MEAVSFVFCGDKIRYPAETVAKATFSDGHFLFLCRNHEKSSAGLIAYRKYRTKNGKSPKKSFLPARIPKRYIFFTTI